MLEILGKLFVAAVLLVAAVLVLAMVLNDPVLETDGSCPPGGLYINLVDQFMSKPFTIKKTSYRIDKPAILLLMVAISAVAVAELVFEDAVGPSMVL